jgi:indole-3-glycerol phosphate synthase
VLTDTPSFQGAPEYLRAARAATGLPVCARISSTTLPGRRGARLGADCILIIMASVEDALAAELEDAARMGDGRADRGP